MLYFVPDDDIARGAITSAIRRYFGDDTLKWFNLKTGKEQLELLKTLWGLLDTIIGLLQIVRIYTLLILDTVSSGFSEFPNSMRPPCTTMPLTIWPALVVLWGVCWMFVTPPIAADELQLQLSLQDVESTPFSSSGM
jgi:hypothetical protein